MKKYYHATDAKNLSSILVEGIHVGVDSVVYLAETPQDALKFIAIRLIGKPIIVFEIEFPEDELSKVKESFDHSYSFFQMQRIYVSGRYFSGLHI